MVKVKINYEGELRCQLEHELSGKTFKTDAPVDNNGKGESFSPTDLCASALGSCIATIIGMQMEALGLDLNGNFSGVFSATSSMSTPPSVEAMIID